MPRAMSREPVGRLAATAATALSVLLIYCAPLVEAQDTRIPERLSRQVAPNSSVPWRPPALNEYTSVLKAGERLPIDPQKRYELVELIDLAQRMNPETRVAWEGRPSAASAVGLVQSEYFPVLSIAALGGYKSVASPRPGERRARTGFFAWTCSR